MRPAGTLLDGTPLKVHERANSLRGLSLVDMAREYSEAHGVSTRGSTCYVTHFPCINCTKALINAGITRLIYSVAYRTDVNAVEFLRTANIEALQVDFKPDDEKA